MADRPVTRWLCGMLRGVVAVRTPLALVMVASLSAATLGVMGGCESTPEEGVEVNDRGYRIERVVLGDEEFRLEVAADDEKRILGLGGRTSIDPNGGMLFIFKDPAMRAFVMRDCVIPIDIIYLSRTGRIVRMYEMQPEAPRGPDESDMAYNRRLKTYPSGTPSQFIIELAGGRAAELGLKVGETVDLDIERLKGLAR